MPKVGTSEARRPFLHDDHDARDGPVAAAAAGGDGASHPSSSSASYWGREQRARDHGENDSAAEMSDCGSASDLHTRLQRQEQQERENAPMGWKLFAFGCTLLMGFGSHFSAHVLSALKSALKADLGINNAQYGVLQAAVSLVNTVVPLIGGRFIDIFGVSNGSIVSCSLIMVGALLLPLSAQMHSFSLMVVGRFLYGLGSMTIVTVQHTILAHWFRGSALAITVGIQIATSRLASFLSVLTTIPIRDATGWYGYAFWVAFALCFASCLVDVVYVQGMRVFYRRRSGSHGGAGGDGDIYGEEELAKLRRKMKFQLGDVYRFPSSFWAVAWLSFALGSTWTAFLHISPEMIMQRFNQSEGEAATNAAIGQFLPVVLAPFLGYFIDRHGRRPLIIAIACITLVAAFLMLWHAPWPPAIALTLFSVSLTFGPVAMVSAVGLLIPPEAMGTALGIYKSLANIGSTLLDPLIGLLQDAAHSYGPPLAVLTALAGASLVLTAALYVFDHTHYLRGLLSAGADRRKQLMASMDSQATPPQSATARRTQNNASRDEVRPLLVPASSARTALPTYHATTNTTTTANAAPSMPSPHRATDSPISAPPALPPTPPGSESPLSQSTGTTPRDAADDGSEPPSRASPSAARIWWGRCMVGTMFATMVAGWIVFLALYGRH